LRTYKTRNTGTSSQFDYTTTGTRASLFCDTGIYPRLIGSVFGRDMLMEECVRAMQQRLRMAPSIKKRAKSVYSQRNLGTIKNRKREKKEEKEVGGGETIMRILRMRFVFSTQTSGFSSFTYTDARPDRIHPTSSRNNCRSWRRCRPNRNSASVSNRSGRPRGRAAQRASQKYQLCQKYLLDLWSRVPYNPISLSEEGGNTSSFFFPLSPCCGYLAHQTIPPSSIHPSSLPCSALFPLLLWVPPLL
jgi:hypothetical protein